MEAAALIAHPLHRESEGWNEPLCLFLHGESDRRNTSESEGEDKRVSVPISMSVME